MMDPVRSLLYVPANEPEWVKTAPTKYDADAIIYDLEDSVPPGEKQEAREILKDALPALSDAKTTILARVNPSDTGELHADLQAVCSPGLDAVVLPKLSLISDVRRTSYVLDHLEAVTDVTDGIDIVLLPETARAFTRCEDLCSESDRVVALIGASSPAGDIERALGFEWTRDGRERQHFLSKLVMDGQAADLEQFIAGPWLDVEDLEGLRSEAEMTRQFGYTGFQVIHPSHIEVVNDVFTPDRETAELSKALISAFEDHDGQGVFTFDGEMVDTAHLKRARQIVDRAEAFDVL